MAANSHHRTPRMFLFETREQWVHRMSHASETDQGMVRLAVLLLVLLLVVIVSQIRLVVL